MASTGAYVPTPLAHMNLICWYIIAWGMDKQHFSDLRNKGMNDNIAGYIK